MKRLLLSWSLSVRSRRAWRTILAFALTLALLVLNAAPGLAEEDFRTPPPFGFSGFAAEGRQHSPAAAPPKSAALYPSVAVAASAIVTNPDVNIIGNFDVTQLGTIGSATVKTCDAGKQTAQNETPVAVNPGNALNLVAGANDYRLYEGSENRYDGSGGFYVSTNGGLTWTVGLLPGLVLGNVTSPGPYQSAGDPAIAAGPSNNFWYANLTFNRTDNANAVAASRSTDGGFSWTTSFVIQTSAAAGATLFNDKEWIAADPTNANVAYVTWTQFRSTPTGMVKSSPIMLSKTTNGGASWSAPTIVSPYKYNQGSVVQVDGSGNVHVVYEASARGRDVIAYSFSSDGGATFTTKILATDSDIPSPLPGATYRVNSFPAFALDEIVSGGTVTRTLHVVWSNWNGSNADIVYVRSSDGGAHWTTPVAIVGSSGDQFFPWIGANNGKVFMSYFDRAGSNNTYQIRAVASAEGGAGWASPVGVSTASSNVSDGNQFEYPRCKSSFIGDYGGIAVGSDGVAHPVWTDIRIGNGTSTTADQDPYTAKLTIQ